jgi:hypothetical protein
VGGAAADGPGTTDPTPGDGPDAAPGAASQAPNPTASDEGVSRGAGPQAPSRPYRDAKVGPQPPATAAATGAQPQDSQAGTARAAGAVGPAPSGGPFVRSAGQAPASLPDPQASAQETPGPSGEGPGTTADDRSYAGAGADHSTSTANGPDPGRADDMATNGAAAALAARDGRGPPGEVSPQPVDGGAPGAALVVHLPPAPQQPAGASAAVRIDPRAFVPGPGRAPAAEETWPAAAAPGAWGAESAPAPTEGLAGVTGCWPADEVAGLTPLIRGVLAGTLPVDWQALSRGADQFFARLEGLGRELAAWVLSERLAPWLAAAAAGAVAYEYARRQTQQGAGGVAALGGAGWARPPETPALPPGDEP